MEYTLFPKSKTCASRVVFGCEPLGGADWGAVDITEIQRAAIAALDSGINLFDTAAAYGLGESECNLRAALGSRIREAIISTKVGLSWHSGDRGQRASVFPNGKPDSIRRMVDESLSRLGLHYLPLVLIHWPDPGTPLEHTLEVLSRLREQGKIGELGVSNFDSRQVRYAHRIASISVAQVQYSLLRREAERDLIPTCRSLGVRVMAWGTLAQGLLTGKYTHDSVFTANDRRMLHPNFEPLNRHRGSVLNARLRVIAERHSARPAQVAIRWVLDRPGVAAAIVGIKSRDQLRELAEAANLRLTTEDHVFLCTDFNSSMISERETNAD